MGTGSGSGYSHSNIVCTFLEMLNMVKLHHWKTYSYSTHKATDDLYSDLNSNVDAFIEVLLGKDGTPRVNLTHTKSLPLYDFSSIGPQLYFAHGVFYNAGVPAPILFIRVMKRTGCVHAVPNHMNDRRNGSRSRSCTFFSRIFSSCTLGRVLIFIHFNNFIPFYSF